MTRILHINTDGWFEREGIARTVTAIAGRVGGEHHLIAEHPTGDVFAGLHVVPVHPVRALWAPETEAVFAQVRPDVVHLHGGAWAPLLAYAPLLRRVPVVASVYSCLKVPALHGHPVQALRDAHGASIPAMRTAAISLSGLRIVRRALRTGRVVAVATPDAAIGAALAGAGPVTVAPGAATVSAHRARWSPHPTVVFAGRAETGRGIDDLLAAHRITRAKRSDITLRLLLLPGSASRRYAEVRGPGLDVRRESFQDLEREFAACQLAALPFRLPMTITPPLVAAEAMAVGLPVVSTDLACLTALVHEGNGVTVAPRRPDLLADALLDVLGDEVRWRRLAGGARATIAEEWSWDRAAEGAEWLYRTALGGAMPSTSAAPRSRSLRRSAMLADVIRNEPHLVLLGDRANP